MASQLRLAFTSSSLPHDIYSKHYYDDEVTDNVTIINEHIELKMTAEDPDDLKTYTLVGGSVHYEDYNYVDGTESSINYRNIYNFDITKEMPYVQDLYYPDKWYFCVKDNDFTEAHVAGWQYSFEVGGTKASDYEEGRHTWQGLSFKTIPSPDPKYPERELRVYLDFY